MAKYYGNVGIASTSETKPGVWTSSIHEVPVYGDVIQDTRRSVKSDNLNDNLELNVQVSILANKELLSNFQFIKYCEYLGVKWKVTSITPSYPRITLVLGGVYNGTE